MPISKGWPNCTGGPQLKVATSVRAQSFVKGYPGVHLCGHCYMSDGYEKIVYNKIVCIYIYKKVVPFESFDLFTSVSIGIIYLSV